MSFCRITGRSRGLPKPNYFPLLAPISPADAKRCCRITGKSYGLPSHHYIPVLLTARAGKTKCKITNVAGELGPHHYSPEINYGNRRHELLPDYRYIFPVLDGSSEAQKVLMDMLTAKQVTEDKRYVYTVQERRCSLVFTAQMEAAVRDGDVRDVMLAKDSDTVLIKMKQGRSVSMDFKDFTDDVEMYEGEGPNAEVLKERELEEIEEKKKKRKRVALSSMKKIFENKERLAEVQEIEEEKMRLDRKAKKAKLEEFKHEKHDLKSFTSNNFDVNHMRSKSSIVMCSGDWKDQLHPLMETWDWDTFEKEFRDEHIVPKVNVLPTPVKLIPQHCETEIYETNQSINNASLALETVPCVNPLKPVKNRPEEAVLTAVKELPHELLSRTLSVVKKMSDENKVGMLPDLEHLPDLVKNIKKGKRENIAKITGLTLDIDKAKKFIPGQHINTPQGPVFVPGQSIETPSGPVFVPGLIVNTPNGPAVLPGHIVTNEYTNEPFFLAGQVLQTHNGEEFVCGQTMKNKDDSYRFVEGQTVLSEDGLKFVPGKVIKNGSEDIFVPGQTILTPEGVQFVPGQTMTEHSSIIFTPGQNAKVNNEWQFIPGQVVHHDDELHFVPGATIATPNGLKFVPGQTVAMNGETCFIPGITKTTSDDKLEFVPGTTVDTIDGPKFIEGQVVHTDFGEKFVPGKTIVQANGHVEFSVAKNIEDIAFSEGAPVGLPIDIKTCSLSEDSLYVFGHMIQTINGIQFYPGSRVPKIEGKVVPGRLVKNEANESRFVPGMMVEGIFVPGQIVFTENGEQFVPGQVVDTADGPKFVPGQVVNTKTGPKFVPGQTIHTIDGPRFVPGQIIETKAGPTFIPGQVISTEDEGSRFVPGQVVDTEEGPRFVPGRVIETDDHGVTFVPGQIVQTPEGLKFVAPDLTEGEEGLEFSVQSFLVTPEELKLLKVKTNPNDTTSTKGELTIDRNMLRQLSEAGMSIGRQVPAELPAINVILNETRNAEALKAFVTDYGLKDDVANQLMDVITSIIEMSVHLKSEIHENQSNDDAPNETRKRRSDKKKIEVEDVNGLIDGDSQYAHKEHVKNSIAAAVLAALVTAEQFEKVNNNNNGKAKYQLILKSIDTILGKVIDEDFVTSMFKILQTEENKDILCDDILENTTQPKVELIKIAINNTSHKHSFTEEDIIEKFGEFLASENEVLGPAFKNISRKDSSLLRNVFENISDSISFIKTDHEATDTLHKAIVAAVQEASAKELELMMTSTDKENLRELIVQSVGLAKILGMRDVASKLLYVMNDEDSLNKISTDTTSVNILKRLTVMRKLADDSPTLNSALKKLEKDPELARLDPKLRDLVRESAALMIVPEEAPLLTSDEIPISLLDPENSLAMEDFLYQRKQHSGALLIIKKGLQAVVPREASRAVLTGQIAYKVLDENGIRHFEPLHVFSALNLSQPTAHRFSMYSCPVVDDDEEDLQSFSGYCNISNNQRITKFGGWSRRQSGVLLDRENTRSRMSSLENTPSYSRYSSRSLSRSRSSCSRSPPKVEDVVVASSDYTATSDDEVSLKAGDIVEILDTKAALGSKRPRPDPALDLGALQLLDASAAKHKRAVRPKKNHPKTRSNGTKDQDDRWLVRVVEEAAGGEVRSRQGLVPAAALQERRAAEHDQAALAARRQAVVRELIETEEEFGRDMLQVVSRYMKPADKASTPKPVFDNRELLFSNFRQICEFHNTMLLEGIKYYASEPRMLGRALLRMEREFDKHVAYCRDQPRALHLLASDPVVNKYFQDLADSLGDDKGITEHLKLPIQRINDYQLLLKELVKYSKRLGDDSTDLQKALDLFLSVPNRSTDNKFIASIEGYRGNIYKLGRLLTHDWFTVTDAEGTAKERYLFLFKARVLICKVKRVSDDRSVFLLKDIIKLPEVEAKDRPGDPLRFDLQQKKTSTTYTLTAHKEYVKTNWLAEIKQNASDVVALAEHAADDLQVVSPQGVTSPEPQEDKKKKREHTESDQVVTEKRLRVEEREIVETSSIDKIQQSTSKRKASTETDVATKLLKSEVSCVSETQASAVTSSAKCEVTSTQQSSAIFESVKVQESSRNSQRASESTQQSVLATSEKSQTVASSKAAVSEVKEQSELVTSEKSESVTSSKAAGSAVKEQSVLATSEKSESVALSKTAVAEVKDQSVLATSAKSESVASSKAAVSEVKEQSVLATSEKSESVASAKAAVSEVKQQSVLATSEKSESVASAKAAVSEVKEQSVLATSEKSESVASSEATVLEVKEHEKSVEVSAKDSASKAVSSIDQKSEQTTATDKKTTVQELEVRSASTKSSAEQVSVTTQQASSASVQSTAAGASSVQAAAVSQSTVENKVESTVIEAVAQSTTVSTDAKAVSVEETSVSTQQAVTQKSASEQQSAVTPSEACLKSSTAAEKVASSTGAESTVGVATEQTVTTEQTVDDEMSRYSRSSRLSGDYSSSRKVSSYESSDSTGLSSYTRRESGSRIESGKYEAGGTEGSALSRIESKYSSIKTEGGSKYGIESSSESSYDTTTKLDSVASKYGIDSNSEAPSKLDSIAAKYGRKTSSSNGTSVEGASSKYSLEASTDSKNVQSISSKSESKYESMKNGVYSSSSESQYSKTVANGSIGSGQYESAGSISRSASQDGRPVFSKTLEGQNIEPGENAVFECALRESEARVTWLRDNKPLADRLMDRVNIRASGGAHRLELQHCREDDSGVYTARAENARGNAHCTAQLLVQELTAEERKERNATKVPFFVVALKDTEIMENTYLRFMVKVTGDPNPEVKFYREDKEIASSAEGDRVSIVRTRADRGWYELVIADVTPADAGAYSCRALNIYGDVSCQARVSVVDDKNIFFELPPGGEGLLAKGEKPTFTWKRDGQTFDPEERFKVLLGDDEDSLALVFQHVRPEDAGLYTCVAKTSTGNISCSAELTVQGAVNELHREPEKPSLVIEHREAIVAAGASAMLELQCKGFPKPSVVFKHDGKIIEADTRHKFLYEDEENMSLVIKNVSTADAGEYHVTASNELGEDTTTLHLVVRAAPKISAKIENQTCMAGSTHSVSVHVEGAPTPTLTFYKDGVELKGSDRVLITKESDSLYKITIKDAKLSDTGSYSVVAKNEVNQCSDFWQWQVTSPPKIIKKLGGDQVCSEKETVTFKVETEAEPAPTVKWFKNKTEVSESSTLRMTSSGGAHALVVSGAARADAGEYSCEIRNVHGSAQDSASLHVRGAPVFTRRLADRTAKDGERDVELSVDVLAYPEPSVRWYLGDVEITEKKTVFTRVDSGTSHKLILREVSAEYAGRYTCRVANELGEDQCQATFTVNRKPRFTKSLVDMTVDAGQTLKLEVEVEGCPEPKVKWFKDGKDITTDARIKIERDTQRLENYHLTVTLVKEEDGGEYEVRAENEMGSVSSKSTVTVHTREVHSTFTKENLVENELEDESKSKKMLIEESVDTGDKNKAVKGKTQPEEAEEKSFWDNENEDVVKKVTFEDVDSPAPTKAKKSLTEPEAAEEKSIWDENHNEQIKKPVVQEVEDEKQAGQKSVTKPEAVEEMPADDTLKSSKRKSVKRDSVKEEPMSAETEGRVFETVTTFKTGEDGSIVVSKVSSSRSHGAIVTGPAETRTLHKMTSSAVYYDDDDDELDGRRIIRPNKPHRTSLEVEEIASHSYFVSDLGQLVAPELARLGTHGLVEEPPSDSEAGTGPLRSLHSILSLNSLHSLSDDDAMHRDMSSREMSIEDLSKSIFDIDDTKKVFSKDSYVRSSSFKEDYFIDEGEEESYVLSERSHKVYENDITERLISISKEFDDNDMKLDDKFDGVKGRIVEELVLSPTRSFDNITKNTVETSVERKRKSDATLFSVAEEQADDALEALLKRSQQQRTILDDIITQEEEKAPPTLGECNMADGVAFESRPLEYVVRASGAPPPTARWLLDGCEVAPGDRIRISAKDGLYKLIIDEVQLKDAGLWQCELSNGLGKQVQQAQLSVTPMNEYRKPIFTTPLEAQSVAQRSPVALRAVCTAHPLPHASWLLNGAELAPSAALDVNVESRALDNGLLECVFTLNIPSGRHTDTGEYTIRATNEHGVGESSARLDILLRPELEGLKDVVAQPYEETSFFVNVRANPLAEVKWSKDGYVIQPSERHDIKEDKEAEQYSLVLKSVSIEDGGVYTVTATNELGEATMQAKLSIHTGAPTFSRGLQPATVRDYEDVTLRVRCDGVPKPQLQWLRDGRPLDQGDRIAIDTRVGGQVDSELTVSHFCADDVGKYCARAVSVAGEATTEARVDLAKAAAGFGQRPPRQLDVDEGEPLLIKAKLDGSPLPQAVWYKDGVPLASDDARVQQAASPDGCVRLSIERASPADCGAYKLVVSNPHGDCAAQCAVAVNPTPRKPSFSQPLAAASVAAGAPLRLEARVMAFPAPEVKWYKDGLPVRPSQAVNFINQPGGLLGLSVEAARPEDAGLYSLTVTNRLGEVTSEAPVAVGQKERRPAFVAELMPAAAVEGFPAKLEVKVLGHPPPAVKWTHDGVEVVPDGQRVRVVSQPDGSHALLIAEAKAADAGRYAVVAANEKGEAACQADLTVAEREDKASPQERAQLVHALRGASGEEGGALQLAVPVRGNPAPTVSWTKDGRPLEPSPRQLHSFDGNRVGLEISDLEMSDAGVYGVRVENPLGADSSQAEVAVRKVYAPPAFTQRFSDLQQLPSLDAMFPARVLGVPAPEVSWQKDGVPLPASARVQARRDGDKCCLYVRDLRPEDAGRYSCVAVNREGRAQCDATLHVVDKIGRAQRMEPPSFLKRIGDIEVIRGMSAKFTACATGTPDPDVEWFRNGEKLFPCERIRMDKETTGLLRLTLCGVDPSDVGEYACRIFNAHGEEQCTARLAYDTLEPQTHKRPIGDQYSDFDKMKRTGVPMPLADKPIISRMADRHLTLSWRPSIPHGPRFPVTYQVEMCALPSGEWFTARTGLRSCACEVRNLEPFRDYRLRVRVENQYGVSDPSPYAQTQRARLEPEPPKFVPYLAPGIDFRPDTSPYFPKDFDVERPPHDGYAQAPRFLRQEHDSQYGLKGHSVNLFWFVYGYPKPKMTYFFNDEPIEAGGRYDWSYTRNGQATLFINRMMERDAGWYEAVATNEHGQARQRVRLEAAEYPAFIRRPEEAAAMQRGAVRLEARLAGVPFPDVKWYKDWQPLAASARHKIQFIEPDTTVLTIHDVLLKDEGLYSVSARNVAGSVSASAMLHVEEDEHLYSERVRDHPPRVTPRTKPFGDFYDLGDELGRGVQGVVYHAAERLSGRNYAAKIMHGHSALKPFMKNELDIMNLLNDRHLVRLHDAYEHEHTLALVTELAAGGELVRDRLLRAQGYGERELAGYVRQLLRGLRAMHERGVAHLGLTIGELLLSHAGSDELKICDFGLSRRIQYNQHASLDYGMPEFVAPEVAAGEGVSFAADLWSVGVITYILLSGHSPFRGANDRETLTKIREGKWDWHDEEWWSRLSRESRDFISKLLVYNWHERMDVNAALAHPWLALADKVYQEEYVISTDRLRNYYNLYRDWTGNAQCRTWFRRRPLSGAFEHPSKMVYPPGETYTPEGTPERERGSRERSAGAWDLKFKQWEHPDWEVSAKSESHYQNGPDTYLLQLRDVQFPVRLREYMKVACGRSPTYTLGLHDNYDPRTPIIRERRRFTDIMDEEIDDEQRERISRYGAESFAVRRLRHELGTRLDSYAEAEALMEAKRDGTAPFFREKPQLLPVREGEAARLACLAVGEPRPSVQWFRNDMVLAEGARVRVEEDAEGRSTLHLEPAMHHDVGAYKVVARNKLGQTVARARVVEACAPDAPDSPLPSGVSAAEVLLRWRQPKHDGNSPVLCYGLQYKEGDKLEWVDVAKNIDHEFYVVRGLRPETSHQFRLASRNRIGWSEWGIPTQLVKTMAPGAPEVEVTRAMRHLQQLTESGQEVALEEDRPKLNYATEDSPIDWDTSDAFAERYSFVSELWRGKFSIVVKGVDRRTDTVVVAKILENRPETEVQMLREFECLRRLRHERVANLLAAYKAPGSPVAAFILEKLQGADVLTYLASRHSYSEQTVAHIVAQLLDALQYLHWRGWAHLDLQPDNVVMASVRAPQVKLVDFGCAHRVTRLGTSVPQVGDLDYKAPEIVNDEPAYPQTDMWSLGVLTYIMLSGVAPFRGQDDHETKMNISFVRYRFEHLYKEITQEATRFLMFLFKKVPLKRPTAEEAHEHRWLALSDFMSRKRERALFLGHRLKEFSDEYHERKGREASQADAAGAAFAPLAPRTLTRSNSIQEELLTNFAT